MSTGSGYDMILLSIKGPGGARIAPTRLRAPRRPRHHASPSEKRRGQRHHRPSASSRPTVRARRETAQEPTAPCAESVGTTAQRHEDRTTTGGDTPRALSPTTRLLPHGLFASRRALPVRFGQRCSVARQGDLSKRPDVRGKTNGPPTRPWSTATNVRATRLLPGTRPPPLRTWAVHDYLPPTAAAGGRTRMFLRRRTGLRLGIRQPRPY